MAAAAAPSRRSGRTSSRAAAAAAAAAAVAAAARPRRAATAAATRAEVCRRAGARCDALDDRLDELVDPRLDLQQRVPPQFVGNVRQPEDGVWHPLVGESALDVLWYTSTRNSSTGATRRTSAAARSSISRPSRPRAAPLANRRGRLRQRVAQRQLLAQLLGAGGPGRKGRPAFLCLNLGIRDYSVNSRRLRDGTACLVLSARR